LVVSQPFGFAEGRSVTGILERDLDDRLVAMIAGQRHAAAGDWAEFAALDAELGRIRPGEALFDPASRLRIHWRLTAQDPEAAAEAQAIAEALPEETARDLRVRLQSGRPSAARR
jgi:hypothetical protein